MKFISWNVNGLRACVTKGFLDVFKEMDADFFCLQETKLQEGQISLDLPGYHQFWCSAQKKGYSGTAIFTRHQPMNVTYGLGIEELDTEGRLITLEYPEFYLVTCYTPNAQRGLARIDHRLKWEAAFRTYLKALDCKKPVILCGDLNVAHQEIDLKNPGSNRGNAGFSDEERGAFSQLLASGFTDTFRHLYPTKTGAYSWWSYMFNARQNNAGWRIDYFVVSDRLKDAIHEATIHPEVMGSDHCPVGVDLNITCNGGIRIPDTHQTDANEDKEAAGAIPSCPVRFWRYIAIPALALVLLMTIRLLTRKPPDTPTPTQPQNSATILNPNNLIEDVIDRTGTIERSILPVSSDQDSFRQYLVSDTARWDLGEYDLTQTTFRKDPTTYLQVIFNPDYPFTQEDAPEITINQSGARYYFESVYYYEGHRVAGCFIVGYQQAKVNLSFTVSYQGITADSTCKNLGPDGPKIMYSDVITYQNPVDIILDSNAANPQFSIQFQTESESWNMYSPTFIGTSINWRPNFFVRISFLEETMCTRLSPPTVNLSYKSMIAPDEAKLQTLYYLDDSGLMIDGLFLFGYISCEIDVTVNIRFTEQGLLGTDSFLNSIPIHAEPNFHHMTTAELVDALNQSKPLLVFSPLSSTLPSYSLYDYIQTAPVQNLLEREDAIDVMLDNFQTFNGVYLLLSHQTFQEIMTDEQYDRYMSYFQTITLPGDDDSNIPVPHL